MDNPYNLAMGDIYLIFFTLSKSDQVKFNQHAVKTGRLDAANTFINKSSYGRLIVTPSPTGKP